MVPKELRENLVCGELTAIEIGIRTQPVSHRGKPEDAKTMLHLYALAFYWEAQIGQQKIRYNLRWRLVNRSLVVETEVEGPSAPECSVSGTQPAEY